MAHPIPSISTPGPIPAQINLQPALVGPPGCFQITQPQPSGLDKGLIASLASDIIDQVAVYSPNGAYRYSVQKNSYDEPCIIVTKLEQPAPSSCLTHVARALFDVIEKQIVFHFSDLGIVSTGTWGERVFTVEYADPQLIEKMAAHVRTL